MIKSPFLILENFMSPMECENLLSSIDVVIPNYDRNDDPIKTVLKLPLFRQRVWNRLESYFDIIENYYNIEIESLSGVDLEWYPELCVEESPRCENSIYNGKKWTITNDHDFTIIVFLKDYNQSQDFDEEFECYGGQLEMTNHGFSINPRRGTAVIFPGNQYFINKTQSPKYGDAFQLRTNIICSNRFVYNKDLYRGNYSIWFKGLT